MEGRALAGLGFGPDAPAVPVDDALHGGEADAGALELELAVQPLKGAEELVGVLHVEAGAVVANEESAAEPAKRDQRGRILGGELPGVAEEVLQGNPEQARVAVGHQVRLELDLHLAGWSLFLQLVQDDAREAAQVDRLALEL